MRRDERLQKLARIADMLSDAQFSLLARQRRKTEAVLKQIEELGGAPMPERDADPVSVLVHDHYADWHHLRRLTLSHLYAERAAEEAEALGQVRKAFGRALALRALVERNRDKDR